MSLKSTLPAVTIHHQIQPQTLGTKQNHRKTEDSRRIPSSQTERHQQNNRWYLRSLRQRCQNYSFGLRGRSVRHKTAHTTTYRDYTVELSRTPRNIS